MMAPSNIAPALLHCCKTTPTHTHICNLYTLPFTYTHPPLILVPDISAINSLSRPRKPTLSIAIYPAIGLAWLGWAGCVCVCVFAGMCWVTTHQIFDHDEYYTSRDPALLASNFTDILAFLSYSWRHLLGRPTITLMATHWLLGNYVTLHPPLENPSK